MTERQLTDMFMAWLAKQPANRTFDYGNNENCPIATALKESGVAGRPVVGGITWSPYGVGRSSYPVPAEINLAARKEVVSEIRKALGVSPGLDLTKRLLVKGGSTIRYIYIGTTPGGRIVIAHPADDHVSTWQPSDLENEPQIETKIIGIDQTYSVKVTLTDGVPTSTEITTDE